ncbi:hypothetical protein D8L93_02675 [Sodalis-like symbiont of Bactericera trigonica]|nr:hypothetical protein D8L93_02675 [Sodalis-like symbiont of Bactericera trigonica]
MMISAAGFAAHHQDVAMSSRELAELTGVTHGEVKRLMNSVLDRWQAREQTHDLPDFTNPAAAARAWAEEFERRQTMEIHLATLTPKANFFDRYVAVDGVMGGRQVCKLLKVKESEFRQFLLERQIMYQLAGVWTLYQQHLDAGRFEVHTGTSGSRYAFSQERFTAKGVKWVADLWAAYTATPQTKGAAA